MSVFTATDLIFNGHNLGAEHGIRVEEVRTTLTQEIYWPRLRVPGRVGVTLGRVEYGSRRIEVDVRIFRQKRVDVTDLATVLAGKLMTNKPEKLITRRDKDRWWLAIHEGSPDFEQFLARGFTTLEFIAPDGVMFSDEITTPLTVGANTVTVSGTFREGALPIVSVTLAGVANTVAISNGTNEIRITRTVGTWPVGTVITFDCETGQVHIGATSGMQYVTLGSRFFTLLPGVNTLTLTGGAGSMRYKPRWA